MKRYLPTLALVSVVAFLVCYLVHYDHAKCEKLLDDAEKDFRFHLLMCVPLDNDADCIKKAYEQLEKALQEAKDMGCSNNESK